MIRLNCFFQAKEGQYDRALEAAIALVAKTQSHAGMVSYDVFESATRPDVFTFIETWADQAALDAHSATPEFKEYVGIILESGEMKIEQMVKE
jgi:quinol monooxygenase YgiN